MAVKKYFVYFGGGLGEDAWDAELVVEADDIEDALDIVRDIIENHDDYGHQESGYAGVLEIERPNNKNFMRV